MRIFITGASAGIGAALARAYRSRDPQAVIGIVARRDDALAQLSAELGVANTPQWAVDVTDRAALGAAAAEFLGRFGVPDVVIANAGISAGTITGEPDDAAVFERILRTNLVAVFDTFAPFVAGMKAARSGSLVGIASVAAIRGLPGAGGYSASKAAVVTYLESLRVELRTSGVRVVTISPGYVRTQLTARNRYRMPFLLDADEFAARAIRAIDARRSYAVIPWQMAVVARVLRLLPNVLFDRLFARAPRKARVAAQAPR